MFQEHSALVTGAQGQLGRAFQSVLPNAMYTSRLELDFSWDREKIIAALEELKPSIIIHTAAYTNVDGAQVDVSTALRINGMATAALVEYCRDRDIPLVYYSTDYVLHAQPLNGHTEDELPAPQSVYGMSKYIGELCVKTLGKGVVIRLSSVFGDGANFVRTMLKLSESMDVIPVVSDQVMRPTYAPDVARASAELLRLYWREGVWELPSVIHMQNSGALATWADYAKQIFFLVGKKTRVREITYDEYIASRPGKVTAPRPTNSLFDMSLLESLGCGLPNWTQSLDEYCKLLQSP